MQPKTSTRYPKRGKGNHWTALELKAIPADWAGDRLNDGDGLIGEVRASATGTVSIRFKYAFRWHSKASPGKTTVTGHHCGTWPAVSLEAIRAERDRARDLVRNGINPNVQSKADAFEAQAKAEATIAEAKRRGAENATVGELFAVWLADGVSRADGNAELRRSFAKNVLPKLGARPLRTIADADIRTVLRAIVARGKNRMAVLLHGDLSQMFTWAEKRQPWRALLPDGNPAALVEVSRVVASGYNLANQRDRILSADEIRELRDIFEAMEASYDKALNKRSTPRPVLAETRLATWICLSTACRIGELLMARWEHVNLDTGEWHVPAENTKTKTQWRVYLSSFALRQFKALHELTGGTEWCFPARTIGRQRTGAPPVSTHVHVKTVSKQVGDRQMQFKDRKPLKHRRNDNTLVLAEGKNGEWTPHDLRRTAATMMQALGVSPDVIDRCQNHVLGGSKVRRHYLHHDYIEEKRAAWRLLGERIEAILAASNVVPLQRQAA